MSSPYASAAEFLADRAAWASASLAMLLADARRRGWIEVSGAAEAQTQLQGPQPSDLLMQIDARLAKTALDVRIVPFEWLRLRLELSAVEIDALWLLACVEVDPAVARLAQAFGLPDCPDLSVQVLRRLLPLSSDDLDRLARLGLIEMATEPKLPMHRRYIRVADRVAELANGELRLDPEVAQIATLHPPVLVDESSATSETSSSGRSGPSDIALVVATGIEGSGRATYLRRIAGRRRLGTLDVRSDALSSEVEHLRRQMRAIVREARLFNVLPLLRDLGAADARSAVIEHELLRQFPAMVLATAHEPPSWIESRPIVVHAVVPLDTAQRAAIWRSELPYAADALVREAAERYPISPGAMVAAAANVKARASDSDTVSLAAIHDGLRDHLGQRLGKLARRVEWKQTWDDLVLPEPQREQVRELLARVRYRRFVLENQGFGDKTAKGHGIVVLLSGEPGTGKTMVAGLVARELGLDLYQVDLSMVVSKYIGETEKGLAKLFDAAESGHIILLFDEADALFAKRSDVKSSNDRYANLETNYLLQRLEAFTGISILTTNNEAAIDDAFCRRIAVHIRFPMPDEDERVHLWRAMLPARASVAGDLNLRPLARDFEMSGGHIKNAVLRAAYLAAASGEPITTEHLRRAARAEYEAMGRIDTTGSRL